MKVALDTNVIVSAVATRGLCADLFRLIIAEHELVLGETVFRELRQVLAKKVRVPTETVEELEAYLRRQATVVPTPPKMSRKGLDSADAAVLAEAEAGAADVLVTGDQRLLEATESSVRVVSPRGLWDLIRRSPG